ncbi:MAG TPA: hypothetical protein VKE42_00230 [Candidatus Cybelea sp.]|nr:hypothetical protein [Candidatus Cybelea sp.]
MAGQQDNAAHFGPSIQHFRNGGRTRDCLPVFNSVTEMRAYKREIHKIENLEGSLYDKAIGGDLDSAHLVARLNERLCAMRGWSSINVRLDPIAAQSEDRPTRFDKIHAAIMRVARGEQANGGALAPPISPATDENPDDRENP